MDIQEKVIEIVAEQLGVEKDKVTPTASFINDLGADSLDVVEMVMAFENAFDIEIPDEDTEKIANVVEAVAYLESKIGNAGI